MPRATPNDSGAQATQGSDDRLDALRAHLPQTTTRPGVYLMRDDAGRVIYVGKARNLRRRLASYFRRPEGVHPDGKTDVMLRRVSAIDTIVTASEKEALILESNLIKRHRPRYNVVLKDDKRYPVLRIDLRHPYPRLTVARRIEKDGAHYFGPFASAQAVRQTLKIVNKTFRLRKCKEREFSSRTRPCLHHQMGACLAPCCLEVDRALYAEMIREVELFLKGRTPELIRKLKGEMAAAADEQEFERAARLRDQVFALERTLEHQSAVAGDSFDRDVVVTASSETGRLITLMFIRNGYLLGTRHFDLGDTVGGEDEVVGAFVRQYYESTGFVPQEILVAAELPERLLLEEILTAARSGRVRILRPKRGEKLRLVKMAEENAAVALKNMAAARDSEQDLMRRLGRRLQMDHPPLTIECVDNSNLGGKAAVAGLVAFENGRPNPAGYRRYAIQGVEGPDDYATMAEVLGRRFGDGPNASAPPDLLMVDGGRGQLNIARAVLKSLGMEGRFQLLAIAKKDERRGETEDKIYLPGRSNALQLGKDRDILLFLQRIRDEAHRYAVSYHRQRRAREALVSELDGIRGIGAKRRQALLRRFGGVDGIRRASLEDIAATPGMDRRTAMSVILGLGRRAAAERTPPGGEPD